MDHQLFIGLHKAGYEIHNKRIVGDPKCVSARAHKNDLLQEQSLVCDWILEKFNIWIYADYIDNSFRLRIADISKSFIHPYNRDFQYCSPETAITAAIDYTVKNLI